MKKWLILCVVLMAPAMRAQSWEKDLKIAFGRAEKHDKMVLLFFSADDCESCVDLEENVFNSDGFKAYASENLVLAKPDFNGKASFETKADNLLIVEKYNRDGFFPLVVILDRSGKELGSIGRYNGEKPDEYIQSLKAIARR